MKTGDALLIAGAAILIYLYMRQNSVSIPAAPPVEPPMMPAPGPNQTM